MLISLGLLCFATEIEMRVVDITSNTKKNLSLPVRPGILEPNMKQRTLLIGTEAQEREEIKREEGERLTTWEETREVIQKKDNLRKKRILFEKNMRAGIENEEQYEQERIAEEYNQEYINIQFRESYEQRQKEKREESQILNFHKYLLIYDGQDLPKSQTLEEFFGNLTYFVSPGSARAAFSTKVVDAKQLPSGIGYVVFRKVSEAYDVETSYQFFDALLPLATAYNNLNDFVYTLQLREINEYKEWFARTKLSWDNISYYVLELIREAPLGTTFVFFKTEDLRT